MENRPLMALASAAAITGLALPPLPRRTVSRNWLGFTVQGLEADPADAICARLKDFYTRRPRPWRTWRGSQRSPRRRRT